MNRILTSYLITSGLICGIANAGTMGPAVTEGRWFGTLSVGAVWENAGTMQDIFLSPTIEKIYAPNKSSQNLADFKVFFGRQQPVSSVLTARWGLALGVTTNARLSGEIWDDADPQFSTAIYNYRIQHTHLAAKGQLLADFGYWVTPWLSGNIGVGFNNASHFSNIPVVMPETQPTPNFNSNTQTAFSYTLGVGVQKTLNEHWQTGVGYEFADWGRSALGLASNQTTNARIKLSHLYTNEVMFSLSYVA